MNMPFLRANKFREIKDSLTHQGAAAAVEIAADCIDALRQPLGQGAVPTHTQPGAGDYRRAVSCQVSRYHIAQRLRCNSSDLCGALRGPFEGGGVQRIKSRRRALQSRRIACTACKNVFQE
jgi:hypothetical protein